MTDRRCNTIRIKKMRQEMEMKKNSRKKNKNKRKNKKVKERLKKDKRKIEKDTRNNKQIDNKLTNGELATLFLHLPCRDYYTQIWLLLLYSCLSVCLSLGYICSTHVCLSVCH